MDPEGNHANPNVCSSCERLLEDDSPMLMADMSRMPSARDDTDELIEQPESAPKPEPKPVKPVDAPLAEAYVDPKDRKRQR